MKKETYRCKDATYTIFDFKNNRYDSTSNGWNPNIAYVYCNSHAC